MRTRGTLTGPVSPWVHLLWLVALFLGAFEFAWWVFWRLLHA
jgi:hypothetical protein